MKNAPEKKLLTSNGGLPTGNGWHESELVEYTRSDIAQGRIDELTRDRDAWELIIGKVAATIPVNKVIGATGTLGDMIDFLKAREKVIYEMTAALKRLDKWFDIDDEVMACLTPDERADHLRQHAFIRAALKEPQ